MATQYFLSVHADEILNSCMEHTEVMIPASVN